MDVLTNAVPISNVPVADILYLPCTLESLMLCVPISLPCSYYTVVAMVIVVYS